MSEADGPATKYAAITPSDSTVVNCRAIYVGTTGNISLKAHENATAVLFSNVPVGILPVGAYIVMTTNTTASTLVALF